MSDRSAATVMSDGRLSLPVLTIFSALVSFTVLQIVAMSLYSGGFQYPLDDTYIHLAIAEEIARGGYGVNAGEYASAGSSPLFPILLVPFTGTDLHRWLPLFWNIVGLVTTAWAFGTLLREGGYGDGPLRVFGVVLASIVPIALNMHSVAFVGMEHALHGAASLLILLGLWRYVEHGKLDWALYAGVFLAPAFRLEGLALALGAAGVVFVTGRRGAGLVLGFLALLPAVLFSGYLMSVGLDPLPNSVEAKMTAMWGPDASRLVRMLGTFLINVTVPAGMLIVGLLVLLAIGAVHAFRAGLRRHVLLAALVGVAAVAHLFFGQIGWLDRYENYLVLVLVATILLLVAKIGPSQSWLFGLVTLAACCAIYLPSLVERTIWNPRAIQLQQGETSRFVKDFTDGRVAVNDLGLMAWQNEAYVLDLWGLASHEARKLRLSRPENGWAGPLVEARNIQLVVIYDKWLGRAVAPEWQRLGTLALVPEKGFLGDFNVSFYATRPQDASRYLTSLEAWAAGLPEGAVFTFESGVQ